MHADRCLWRLLSVDKGMALNVASSTLKSIGAASHRMKADGLESYLAVIMVREVRFVMRRARAFVRA